MANPINSAVVLGISDYEQAGGLPGCTNDAANVSAYLRAIGYSVSPLVSSAEVTKAYVATQLTNLANALGSAPGSRGVFYFSGHGSTTQQGDKAISMLLPYDYRGNPYRGIYPSDLQAWLDPMHKAKDSQLLIILDACCSGGVGPLHLMSETKAPAGRAKTPLQAKVQSSNTTFWAPFEGVTVMTACGQDEQTWDADTNPFTGDERPGGVFTNALFQAALTVTTTAGLDVHAVSRAAAQLLKDKGYQQTPLVLQTAATAVPFPHA